MITCVEEIHREYDYSLNLKRIIDNLIMFSTVTEGCTWCLVSRILNTFWISDKKVFYQFKLALWNSYMTFFTSLITLTSKIRKSNKTVCHMKYYYSVLHLLFLLSFLLIHSKFWNSKLSYYHYVHLFLQDLRDNLTYMIL
jgi:hypothetical protein